MNQYGRVEGQCGTCLFAKEFDYGPSPSGPEDGVHCVSIKLAEEMEKHDGYSKSELEKHGFLDIFRLELLEEPDYRCPYWLSKETEVKEQLLPAPDEAPLTCCPWCGEEYNVKEQESDEYYETLCRETPGMYGIYRHKKCGNLVRFIGGVE